MPSSAAKRSASKWLRARPAGQRIDRTHNQDTGNAQQQDLPAQAKMQPAKSPAGKIHGIPNQSRAQRVHPELAAMRKNAIAVKITR
jgi:hypothetical protein